MKVRTLVIAAMMIAGVTNSAFAADSADVQVTAEVLRNCKIIETQDINFGSLDPANAVDVDAKGAVTLKCTKDVDYALSADMGQNEDGGARRMKAGATDSFLGYKLAQDSFAGVGAGFSSPINVGLAATVSGTDYRDLPADSYADTLRFTVMP
jgi:spore coat protein U-like protein